ncbi:uncharacterized protein LOC128158032 [Crassostrea angulata]|uniref:uncharacterized protein LOC128158032 n=1 Tax=Magallana angulata TaxID=2784310 RepID=UPI0022B10CEF|nr:uncharacterized protein LOC128158032 [Crassostrea angulata]
MDVKEFIGGTVSSFSRNNKLLFISLIVMKVHITQGADCFTDSKCLSDALELYERFGSIVCQNTTSSEDPTQWLSTVCMKFCQITLNKMRCATSDSIMIQLNVSDGMHISFPVHKYSTICPGCHNFSQVNITCKLNFVTCVKNETIKSTSSQAIEMTQTDCSQSQNTDGKGTIEETSSRPNSGTTRTLTSEATCINEGYLVLTALLGLVFGILVVLGLSLIKSKFVKSRLSVLQGESVQNSAYNIPPRASDTEIPERPLTSDGYAKIVKKKITKTRDDGNIYNHLHETRVNSDFNDSPYDHAQCLTEIQLTPIKAIEEKYTHVQKLC